jgi:hypothetical protein
MGGPFDVGSPGRISDFRLLTFRPSTPSEDPPGGGFRVFIVISCAGRAGARRSVSPSPDGRRFPRFHRHLMRWPSWGSALRVPCMGWRWEANGGPGGRWIGDASADHARALRGRIALPAPQAALLAPRLRASWGAGVAAGVAGVASAMSFLSSGHWLRLTMKPTHDGVPQRHGWSA